ncbi:glycosyltransferase family 2 protein [Pseudoalteromonas sp. SCSIO 43088]|uniref:glycosyltransferase family 2 protein n=1 Tax=Pseudoalteromonas sp. SCSIO 43088 TaxID=2822846 RepID=UPI00202B720A|nr:glycosyltransferase family 2 protein [Pseudoalteromonas sp. SCSIO 43088]URQ86602.1 glycosyltransferase family 2 protein [Pseudoalteromonas sp. SCSIO 43088]
MSKATNCSVSVIIPCYNAENWIEKALESVNNQVLKPLEVVVVDDGSTDNTLKVIESYNSIVPIITVTQLNSGPSVARNLGVTKASGQYIAFLDADDEWCENKLLVQMPMVNTRSFSSSNSLLIDQDNIVIEEHKNICPQNRIESIEAIYLGKISMLTPGLVIPKNSFIEVGGFNTKLRYKEDHSLVISLLCSGLELKYIEKPLFKVRVHESSGRNNVDEKVLIKSFMLFSDISIKQHSALEKLKSNFISKMYYILMKSFLGRKPFKACKYAFISFISKPSIVGISLLFISLIPINKNQAVKYKKNIIRFFSRKG